MTDDPRESGDSPAGDGPAADGPARGGGPDNGRDRRGPPDDIPVEWPDDYDRPMPKGVPFREQRDELLDLANVHGHGVGRKMKGGQPTGEVAVRVYVDEKKPEAALAADDVVPPELEGVQTDVIEEDHPHVEADWRGDRGINVMRPAVTGLRGHSPSSWGSYSLWRRPNGTKVMLTARHVAGDTDEDISGTAYYQTEDSNTYSNQLATFDEAGAYYPASGEKTCDSAVGPLESGVDGTRTVMPGEFDLGSWIRPELDLQYVNLGYRTGITGGVCLDVDKTVHVDHGFDTITYEGVYQFDTYSAGGDSGSLTGRYDPEADRFRPVGMHFASNGHVLPYHSHLREAHGPLYPIEQTYEEATGNYPYQDYDSPSSDHYDHTAIRSWIDADANLQLEALGVVSAGSGQNSDIAVVDGYGGSNTLGYVSVPALGGMGGTDSASIDVSYRNTYLDIEDHYADLIASDSSVYEPAQTEFLATDEGPPYPSDHEFTLDQTFESGAQFNGVDISPDGSLIAYAGDDGFVYVYNTDGSGGDVIDVPGSTPSSSAGSTVEFSADGQYLATAWWGDNDSDDTNVTVHDTSDWSTVLDHSLTDSQYCMAVSWAPDGHLICASYGGSLRGWEPTLSGGPDFIDGESDPVYSVSFGPNSESYVYGTSAGDVKLVDFDSFNQRWTVSASANNVSSATFSHDGSYVYAGTWDNELFVLDPTTGATETQWSSSTFNGSIYEVQSHSDGYVLVGEGAGSGDRHFHTIAEGTWNFLHSEAINETVEGVSTYPSGDFIAVATRSGVYSYEETSGEAYNAYGVATAGGSASADITPAPDFSGTAEAAGSASATVRVDIRPMPLIDAGLQSTTAGLSKGLEASGSPTATSAVTGNGTRAVGASTTPTAQALLEGNIIEVGTLAGDLYASGNTSAALSLAAAAGASPSATGTSASDATVARPIAGALTASSGAATASVRSRYATGTATAATTLSLARAIVTHIVSPTATSSGPLSVTSEVARALSASSAATTDTAVASSSARAISGSTESAGGVTADPSRATGASGTAAASGVSPETHLSVGIAPIVGKAGTIEATLVYTSNTVAAFGADGLADVVEAEIGREGDFES